MSNTMESYTNVSVIGVDVFVDVGNEIDDEQLLKYIETIWRSLESVSDEDCGIRFDMRFVFCGYNKLSDADSMKRWITKFAYPSGDGSWMPKCIAALYARDFKNVNVNGDVIGDVIWRCAM